MSSQFRKYLGYAIGELLLVVVGILIALQIDNWNEDRKEQATLQSYLDNIARNMREDLAELEPLRAYREDSLYLISRFYTIHNLERFELHEIFYFNLLWNRSNTHSLFVANTSGFEALKSSGVLNRLQGTGYEQLLSRYLDTVDQIRIFENAMNDALARINTELRQLQPEELEAWAITSPSSLTPERFEEVQPLLAEIIGSSTTAAMVDDLFKNHKVVQLYDRLTALGQAFIRVVESGQGKALLSLPRTSLDDAMDGLGTPNFVVDGKTLPEYYHLTTVSGPNNNVFRLASIQREEDALRIDYPGGAEWASVYWSISGTGTMEGLPGSDFTQFSKLKIELKGAMGGEVIKVLVKDVDYPNDIDPVSVDLVLTDEWQSWEIDLTEFAPNDLSRLYIPLGLLIYPAEEPLSFFIRNAHYQ